MQQKIKAELANIDKNKILTPEVKIKIDQVNKINKV